MWANDKKKPKESVKANADLGEEGDSGQGTLSSVDGM